MLDASRTVDPDRIVDINPATKASPAPDTFLTFDEIAGEVKASFPIFTRCPLGPSVSTTPFAPVDLNCVVISSSLYVFRLSSNPKTDMASSLFVKRMSICDRLLGRRFAFYTDTVSTANIKFAFYLISRIFSMVSFGKLQSRITQSLDLMLDQDSSIKLGVI